MFTLYRLVRLSSIINGILLTSLLGCHSSSPAPEPVQYSVPADIEPYIQAFRKEANKRNYSVATNNLVVTFGDIKDDACGECIAEANKSPRIIINNNATCWQHANADQRECLVFHELGHCLLNRSHKTDLLPNGAFASLMNPNDVSVYAACLYPINDECNKQPRREYYINELFDPSTPTPDWGK